MVLDSNLEVSQMQQYFFRNESLIVNNEKIQNPNTTSLCKNILLIIYLHYQISILFIKYVSLCSQTVSQCSCRCYLKQPQHQLFQNKRQKWANQLPKLIIVWLQGQVIFVSILFKQWKSKLLLIIARIIPQQVGNLWGATQIS